MDDWKRWEWSTAWDDVFKKNYYTEMIKKIKPSEILPHLPSLSQSDEEGIKQCEANYGAERAVQELKDCLLRKGKTKEFIDALRAVLLTELADRMVQDLDIACGRQRSTPQTDRGQGDMTPMTLNHCNVQIGSSNHMTVNQSGDNDSDMSSLEAGDSSPGANVSASLSENVPVGRREQLDTSPDVRSGQLNTSPEVRPGQPNIGREIRSSQVQGQHSLSDEPDVPPYGSVVPSDSADTDVKVLSVATPEPTMDETVSVHEDLSVEVSMTPTWEERDLESQQLRENEGSSDEDTSLLKPCRSIETHASPDGGGSYASCFTGGSTVSDLERDVHDRFSDSAEDSGQASVWPATAGVSLDHHGRHGRDSSPKQTSGDIKGKIRPFTELLDGMVSGTFSDLCVHSPSNVQESNDQSGVSVHSDVSLDQQGEEQNREDSYYSSHMLFFTVAAVVALTAVIFLMKK